MALYKANVQTDAVLGTNDNLMDKKIDKQEADTARTYLKSNTMHQTKIFQ